MQRGGLIEAWRKQFWPSADRCSETATGGSEGSVIQAISVSDMQGSFYLLFGGKIRFRTNQRESSFENFITSGSILAGICFFIERTIHKKTTRRDNEYIQPYLN